MNAISRFLWTRWAIRKHDRVIAIMRIDKRLARRSAAKLEQASPFNRNRVAGLRRAAEEIGADLKRVIVARRDLGAMLVDLAPAVDAATTLEQRLDLLNVNAIDQVGSVVDDDHGLIVLIGALCLEDSAAQRRDQWNDRPMFNAVNAHVTQWMLKTPEGQATLAEAIAPGGSLHGMPTYHQQPGGTVLRKAPALVLHDAAGSRVIERRPS